MIITDNSCNGKIFISALTHYCGLNLTPTGGFHILKEGKFERWSLQEYE